MGEDVMSKITPCLWHKDEALDAALFYTAIFPDSHIEDRYKSWIDTPGNKAGDLMMVEFTIGGQQMQALNGGRHFDYTHAISMSFVCQDQPELDRIWDALLEGGSAEQCGWLKDRYGMSWQIIPKGMGQYLGGSDPEGARRAMAAMMKMIRIDIAALEQAYRGA
jgi:predicted 3-demethylubiquinone-9 3-methyltransferase (glyoxalase superfamily)